MGHFFHIFERRSCQDQNNQGCNSRFSHEYQDSQSSCNQGRCDVSRPSGCGQAGSLELSNPYQRVESQRQLMRGAPEGSYGEDNVLGAIAAAKANGKPILAMNVGREGLSDESKAHLTTLQKDYNVVLIDRAHADQKMSAGLPTNEFWALANLMGAKGDVNNIKDNYMGTFAAKDLDGATTKFGLKPSGESADAKTTLKELAGASKPDAPPQVDVDKTKDVPKQPANSDKPGSSANPADPYDFNQGKDKAKPAGPDAYDFNQGRDNKVKPANYFTDPYDLNQGKSSPKKPGEQPGKPNMPAELNLPPFPDFKPLVPQNLPSDRQPSPKERPDANPEVRPEIKPVKLDQVKFDTDSVEKAFQLAKEKNLPVIVYKGANFCGNCPPVSSAIDNLSNQLKNAPTTEAIVVKLNYERAMQLQRENPALAAKINQLMPLNGSSFPDVKLYNPNDMSKPIKTTNGYGGDAAFLSSLVQTGKAAMSSERPAQPSKTPVDMQPDRKPEKQPEKQPDKVKLEKIKFQDEDFSSAVETAKRNNLPVIVYMGADFCHYCPAASAKVDQSTNHLAAADQSKAIVVKLTYETAQRLASQNSENGRLLRSAMTHGSSVPRLTAFNPNDMQRPIINQTVGGVSQSQMDALFQSAIQKVKNGNVNPVRPQVRQQGYRR